MPDTDPYLVPKSPAEVVHTVAQRAGVPADIADDYLKVAATESGQNINVRNSAKGARGFGQVMPDVKGGTVRTVGGRKYDLTNPVENVEAGLRYFHEGGNDPVARRLHYFGGPKASGHYQRTGEIPNISDGNLSAAQYVKATGGEQSQDPYLVPKGTTQAPPSDDPYLVPKEAAPARAAKAPTVAAPDLSQASNPAERANWQAQGATTAPPPTTLAGTPVKPNDAAWHFGEPLTNLTPRAQKVLQQAVAEDERKKNLYGGVEQPNPQYQAQMRRRAGLGPLAVNPAIQVDTATPNLSIGQLRQQDEPAVANSAFVRAQAAKQAGAQALRTDPNSAQARLYDPQENVAATAEAEQAKASQEAEWRRIHQPEIDSKVATIRKSIRRQGGFDKWLAEFGEKAVSGLIEPAGAVSNAARVQSEAMQQAAEEEGVDRNVVSKFIQNTAAGLIGSAPEMAAMALGAPAIPTFALGGGVRAAAKGQDIPQGVIHGGLSGAAFELPIPGATRMTERPVAKALARGVTTGAGSTVVELGAGQPLGKAAATGATMGLMSGGGQYLHGEPVKAEAPTGAPTVSPELQNGQRARFSGVDDDGKPLQGEGVVLKRGEHPEASTARGQTTIQADDGTIFDVPNELLNPAPVIEPVHHSQLQPRTAEGQFDGPPATPESETKAYYRGTSPSTTYGRVADDRFYTADRKVADEYAGATGSVEELSSTDLPKKIYEAENKGGLRDELGISDTLGEKEADRQVRAKLQAQGYEGVRYRHSIGQGDEVHVFPKAEEPVAAFEEPRTSTPESSAAEAQRKDGALQLIKDAVVTKKSSALDESIQAAKDNGATDEEVAVAAGRNPSEAQGSESIPGEGSLKPAESSADAKLESGPARQETGIKHSVIEAERELQGLPQFQKARRAAGVSFDEGVHAVRSGDIDPRALAMEQATASRARPLSTTESMALLYDRMRISQARKAAEAELDAASKSGDEERLAKAVDKVTELQQASNYNDEADYRTGSELGRGLAIRRELIRDDYSRARVLSKAIAINKGKPLPPKVQAKYEAAIEQLAKAHARIADLEGQQQSQTADAEVEKVTRQMAREVRARGTKRSVDAIKAERATIKQNVALAWAKQKALITKEGTLSQGGLGNLDPEGELTRSLRDLARSYIEEGVVKAADIVDAVHEHIKDVADGITKRQVSDLISGYGRTKESTSDPIERKLNEVKAILAATSGKADVLEKGIRAARRGQQQEKPTEDQRRALRDLQDAMREKGPELGQKPYDVKTEQATPLDKAKTTTRNRIEQLRKWIADGKREVQGENRTIPDAELGRLKAEQAGLEKAAALLDDPAADQKAIEKRLSELSKSLTVAREKVQSGNVTPVAKEGAQQVWTPEIGEMSKERDALRGIVAHLRSEAAKAKAEAAEAAESKEPFFGATGSWADYEAAAKKVLDRQKSFMQRNQKKIAELQKELARAKAGEAKEAKTKREPVPLTDEMKVAQRNANELKRQIEHLDAVTDWVNRSKLQKAGAYGAAITRFNVLSGVKVLGKIGGALVHRIGQQYLEEGAGKGWRSLLPEIASKAPRHGAGINRASEAEFWKGIVSGAKEAPKIIKTGDSDLSLEHGKRYPTIPTKLGTALSIPGRIHAAEKNILKVAEYNRSLELNLQKAERAGLSRSNPEVLEIAKERAYKDAEEAILMGDNAFSRTLSDAQRRWPRLGRDAFKVGVPVSKVPSNYLSQAVGEYGLGLPRGLYRASPEIQSRVAKVIDGYAPDVMKQAARALRERNPGLMEKMTPEEADKTMRLLKRGTLGAVYVGLASLGLVKGGGFYSGQRKLGDIAAGDVEVGGFTIPHWAMHSPPAEIAQFAATIKRDIQDAVKHRKSIPGGVAKGVWHGGKGLADQVPFLSQWVRLTDRSNFTTGEGALKAVGEQIASRVEPQILKELGDVIDREKNGQPTMIPWKGETVPRKVTGFTGPFISRVPIARQTLKKDRKKMAAQAH